MSHRPALLEDSAALNAEIDAALAEAEAGGALLPAEIPAAPVSVPSRPSQEVRIVPRPGESADDALARVGTSPFVPGAGTLCDFMAKGGMAGAIASAGAIVQQLEHQAEAASSGDLTHHEAVLAVQATSLDAIFNALARKAATHIDKHPDATERYLRMALKAQAQCRATVETLAAMKNGPVMFARQVNVNQGGQQQVNNGVAAPAPELRRRARQGGSHGSNEQSPRRVR